MTALELQSEYQSLVSIIANEDYETISKAVKALKKILSPNKTKAKKITKADLVRPKNCSHDQRHSYA